MDWFEEAEERLKKSKAAKVAKANIFTPRARQVLKLARKEADRLHHNYLGVEHLLVGLIELGGGVATNVLVKEGMSLEKVRIEVETHSKGFDEKIVGNIPYTPRMRRVMETAMGEAKALGHTYVGTEHLLRGLLSEKEGLTAEIFKIFKVDMEQLRKNILNELKPPGGDAQKNK